ncbi:MAG: response regulator [Candidatus Sericytochromatia bacterium]|uniref:Response regulator n=1 Tax=Candidatus Tanganyikabacteria bacterium TaxID=2961651 RepID=A0A937X3C6_9BACT|nr:response regulator [Candidatus Tanganyikabacteria bacterium]
MVDDSVPLVLIADDDAEMRRLVRKSLEKLGLRIAEARDGEEAIARLIEHRPQGAVLDVMMPGLNGWEVCKYIRSKPEYENVAVLMLTAIGKTTNEMTAPLYGADAYLDKPFEVAELASTVQRILEERRT